MSLKSKIQALITAANAKTGETDATLTDAVQTLVDGYGQGGTPVINPLSVTANGTYTAPSGVDGYSPVTVNVPGGGVIVTITSDFVGGTGALSDYILTAAGYENIPWGYVIVNLSEVPPTGYYLYLMYNLRNSFIYRRTGAGDVGWVSSAGSAPVSAGTRFLLTAWEDILQ